MASTAAAQAPLSPPPPTAAMASLALASPVPSAPGAPASAGQVQAHQPHGNNLHSIVEAAAASLAMSPPDGYTTHEEDAGMVSSTGEEQDMPDHRTRQHDPESDENEERREIGGGMLREVAIKSGYLLKKGERRKNWKKRYFVLRPDRLCYYKDDREYQVLRHISVADVHACAQIEVKKHDNSFGIVTARRTYYVRADTRKDADEWVLKINRARKEQDARVRAEQEAQAGQQQQQHLAVAGGADNGAEGEDTTPLGTHAAPSPANASVADLPNEPGQSLQAGAMPIPIRSGSNANTGAAPAGIVSPASDSGAFLSTSAGSSHSQGLPARNGVQIPGSGTSMGSSTSASNNANLGYLSSSWASSSSEQYPSSSDRLASAGLPDTSFSRASTVRGGYTGHGQAVPGAVANTSSAGSRAPVTMMGWPGTGGLVDAEGGLVDDPRSGTSRPQLPAHQRTLSAHNGAGSGMLSSSDEEGDVPLSPGGQLEANEFYSPGLSERDAPLSGQGPATHVQPSSSQQQQQHAKKPSFVGANPHRVVLAGYLMKQGSKRKTWRKRWFTLYGDKLVYTRSHMDRKVHREIRLDSILDALECSPKASRTLHFPKMPGVPLSPGGNSQSFASTSGAGAAGGSSAGGLEASPQPSLPHGSAFSEAEDGSGSAREATQSNCFKIITPSRGYVVCAPSEEEEIKWLSALRVLIDALRLEKHPETAEA